MARAPALKPSEALQDDLFASLKPGSQLSLLERALSQQSTVQLVSEITDPDGRSLLHAAVTENNAKAVEMLLDKGVKSFTTDESGWTPLQSAAALGNVEVVDKLLKSVKDPEEKKRFIEAVNESGSRAIHYAASKGHLPVVELLLHQGADVNAKGYGNVKEINSGDNLLHIAVNSESADIYWDVARTAPELEDEPNAEGKFPVACASRDFMKKLEYVIKQSRAVEEAGEH